MVRHCTLSLVLKPGSPHAKERITERSPLMFRSTFLHVVATLYGWIISIGSNLQSLFLLWMRLTWGHQFFLSGTGKLAQMDPVIAYLTTLNIPHSSFHAHLIAYTETLGGIFLCLGFLSRLTAIPLACIMIAALSIAHGENLSHFRFLTDPSALVHEAPYPFLITALLVLAFGPGRISIDGWIKRWADRQPKY